jgi:hypothetical protein
MVMAVFMSFDISNFDTIGNFVNYELRNNVTGLTRMREVEKA